MESVTAAMEALIDRMRSERERLDEIIPKRQLTVRTQEMVTVQENIGEFELIVRNCLNNAMIEVRNLQNRSAELEAEKQRLQEEILEEKRCNAKERKEWDELKRELQVAVTVASNFRDEAEENLERMRAELIFYKDRNEALEESVERSKRMNSHSNINDAVEVSKEDFERMRNELDFNRKRIEALEGDLEDLHCLLDEYEEKGQPSTTSANPEKTERITTVPTPQVTGSSTIESTDDTLEEVGITAHAFSGARVRINDEHDESPSQKVFKQTPICEVTEQSTSAPPPQMTSGSNVYSEKKIEATSNTSHASPKARVLRSNTRDELSSHDRAIERTTELKSTGSEYQGKYNDPATSERYDKLHKAIADYVGALAPRAGLRTWCRTRFSKYPDVYVVNFHKNWRDGLALCALIHSYRPDKIPYAKLTSIDPSYNIALAMNAVESEGIEPLPNFSELANSSDDKVIMNFLAELFLNFELGRKSLD